MILQIGLVMNKTTQSRNGHRAGLIAVGTLVTAFLVGFGAQGATAGVASSADTYYLVGGYEHRNYSVIITSSNSARAVTNAGPRSQTLPTGWAGSRGRLFTAAGALSCEGNNVYSSGPLSPGSVVSGSSCTRNQAGSWKSYGVSLGYNGGSYNSYYTYNSPVQSS